MLVTAPVGSKAGDTLNIQSPSGMQMQVRVPPGVQEGGSFQVAMPAAPPVVVAALAVVVPPTTASRHEVGMRRRVWQADDPVVERRILRADFD